MKFIFSLLLLISLFSYGQNKISSEVVLGFACYAGGSPSESVELIDEIISEKNIPKLRDSIYSDMIVVAYLSGAILKELESKNIIAFSNEENEQFMKVLASNKIIRICYTCLFNQETKINLIEKG